MEGLAVTVQPSPHLAEATSVWRDTVLQIDRTLVFAEHETPERRKVTKRNTSRIVTVQRSVALILLDYVSQVVVHSFGMFPQCRCIGEDASEDFNATGKNL